MWQKGGRPGQRQRPAHRQTVGCGLWVVGCEVCEKGQKLGSTHTQTHRHTDTQTQTLTSFCALSSRATLVIPSGRKIGQSPSITVKGMSSCCETVTIGLPSTPVIIMPPRSATMPGPRRVHSRPPQRFCIASKRPCGPSTDRRWSGGKGEEEEEDAGCLLDASSFPFTLLPFPPPPICTLPSPHPTTLHHHPSSLLTRASKTVTSKPSSFSCRAAVSPPIPAPITAMCRRCCPATCDGERHRGKREKQGGRERRQR